MAVFIELTTRPITTLGKKAAGSPSGRAGLTRVRRPMRGIEIKEDTYAYLKVVTSDGTEIQLLDSSSSTGRSTTYSNFILQSVQDTRMERHQFIETFGETYLFLFGESPHMMNIQAMVLNTHDFNWKAEFLENYKRYFRGTRCVELKARCYLFYDDVVLEGYIMNATTQETADNPHIVPLSFQFFVCEEQNISFVGDPNFPLHASAIFPEGIDPRQPLNGEQVQQLLDQGQLTDGENIQNGHWNVQGPIRGLISDNYDEYTRPDYPTQSELQDLQLDQTLSELDSLLGAMQQSLDQLNAVSQGGYEQPGFWDSLGIGPSFNVGGATFGATLTPGSGFKTSSSGLSGLAKATKSILSGDFKSVNPLPSINQGASALGGAFGNFFQQAGNAVKSTANTVVKSADALSNAVSKTASGAGKVTAAVLSAANPSSTAGLVGEAFAAAKKAASAGGYSTGNSSLGQTVQSSSGSAQSGNTGNGVGTVVGGKPTAFALVSAEGSLDSLGTTEESSYVPSASWHKNWSWPSSTVDG